ncbi:histidinol-phosphatase HisJ family protein [Psychrilyobacter atlanticus]|uniref:histidinol-phosphatase HisJ family protein n=1 Tax=Psychrilyobacter atlanticus TaxID=271091 RepID=UPI0004219DE7|nr:histidinol-phosphatase HisJ family protein [Psychrilyobacter atlanticus]
MCRSDYHIHSEFSGDCEEKLELIFESAIKKGLKEVAITDHLDLDYPGNKKMFDLNFKRYIEILKEYRDKYKGRLEIKIGLELGLQPHLKDDKFLNEILSSKELDFIIGSTHCVEKKELDKDEFFSEKTKDESHKLYFDEVYKNIRAFNGVSVCGHLDFVKRYGKKYFKDHRKINYPVHGEAIDKILKVLIRKEMGLEINTSGYRYGGSDSTPNEYILRRYSELGGKIITLGSDAHRSEDIGEGLDKACKLLKNCGFNSYSIFNKKQVQFKKIN